MNRLPCPNALPIRTEPPWASTSHPVLVGAADDDQGAIRRMVPGNGTGPGPTGLNPFDRQGNQRTEAVQRKFTGPVAGVRFNPRNSAMAAAAFPAPRLVCDDLMRPSLRCKPAWPAFRPCSRASLKGASFPCSLNRHIPVPARVLRSRLTGARLQVSATRVRGGQSPPKAWFVPRAGPRPPRGACTALSPRRTASPECCRRHWRPRPAQPRRDSETGPRDAGPATGPSGSRFAKCRPD